MAKKDFTMEEVAADMDTAVMPDQMIEEVEDAVMQEPEEQPTGLMVERDSYTSNGKRYLNYLVKGLIKGKQMKSELAPLDPGSYDLLNIMYGGVAAVQLYRAPFEFKDDKGKKISGEKYYVIVEDDELGRLRVQLKPKRDSDKNILQIFLRIAARNVQG